MPELGHMGKLAAQETYKGQAAFEITQNLQHSSSSTANRAGLKQFQNEVYYEGMSVPVNKGKNKKGRNVEDEKTNSM